MENEVVTSAQALEVMRQRGLGALADRMGIKLLELSAERAETDPKVFTRIHLHFKVRGKGLRAQLVEHAIKRSHDKYCSATAMLQSTATITHDYEIVELG